MACGAVAVSYIGAVVDRPLVPARGAVTDARSFEDGDVEAVARQAVGELPAGNPGTDNCGIGRPVAIERREGGPVEVQPVGQPRIHFCHSIPYKNARRTRKRALAAPSGARSPPFQWTTRAWWSPCIG